MSDDEVRATDYPVQWEADVVLRDGSVTHLRPIRPDDAEGIERFHSRQSAESIYLRFFAPIATLSRRDLHRFTHVDHVNRVALVATVRDDIVGVSRFDRLTPDSAEVAFNISDHFQGRGLGSVMLEHLAAIAQELGVTRFIAEVLPQNRKMLGVFSEAGYDVSRRIEDGVVNVTFDIEPTEKSTAVRMAREHRAEAVSMQQILSPGSVAVVGASADPDSMGHHLMSNILSLGFVGTVHPVNTRSQIVFDRPTVARVSDVEGPVDLALIAVPPSAVLEVVDDCADKGVKSLVVVSAGFAESDPEGARIQTELVTRVRGAGMRLVGPNSFGLINMSPSIRLNASLAQRLPQAGRLGLFSQSGALGIATLASAARRNLGISVFASAGNRADVSGNDFMQYWIDDDETDVVGLYLESMGNPRKFSRIARHLASRKPVIVIKSGVSTHAITPGHAVRRSRARPEAFRAMLRQAGVIRVANTHQMFDIAQLMVNQPLPAGNRVAIISNSHALSALTKEAAQSNSLVVTHGPLSLPSESRGEVFRTALAEAVADPEVDSVITCFVPPLVTIDEDVANAVRDAARESGKPCLATFLGMRGVDRELEYVDRDDPEITRAIPRYTLPEDAVRSLAAATRYAEWLAKDRGVPVAPAGINRKAARDLVDRVLGESPGGRSLDDDESAALLASYGISLWPRVPVETADDAVRAADTFGYPVVVKSVAPLVRHQPGSGGIRIDLGTADAVREAFIGLGERLRPLGANRFVVQKMATPGVACVINSIEDPSFGPVLAFSIAGTPTELLEDISYRIPPLTDVDVSELIEEVRAAPLLHGHRGAEPVHRPSLDDLVARVSVLTDDLPEVARLLLNPVNAHPGGVEVLGAEILVAPVPRRTDTDRRTLLSALP